MTGRHRSEGLAVLWRGPLSSCNYACSYCPFAKRKDTRAALAKDKEQLEQFCRWAQSRTWPVSVLFTPWGEALLRRHYREAMVRLSHAGNLRMVAIQTNLSCPIDWIESCDTTKVAFWATFHPGQTARAKFLEKLARLDTMDVRYSVGVVGRRDFFDEIEALRAALPSSVYLWINAERSLQGRYKPHEIERLAAIDPLFELNDRLYRSRGRACAAGETAIAVDGDGVARRCHFIETPIGNIYDENFEDALQARQCTRSGCNCHIGYSYLTALDLRAIFGEGLLERRAPSPTRDAARRALAAFDTKADG